MTASPSWQVIQQEATELVASAAAAGITIRVVGSAGIRMHCATASNVMDEIGRPAKDLDVIVTASDRARLRLLLETRGFEIDRDLLVAMEGRRFAYRNTERGIDLDVFVEKLEFCHTIELGGRWELHQATVPIEELLLQKLQVHEPTQSDLMDSAVVLATHPVGTGGPEEIDPGYIAGVLARDWGFHRDASTNLARVGTSVGVDIGLPAERVHRVHDAVAQLSEAIAEAKKSMAWRMRARVGERMQWWEDVDEKVDTY